MATRKMSLEAINARLDEIRAEARNLVEDNGEIRDDNCDKFDALTAESDELKQERSAIEARMTHLRELAGSSGHVEHGSQRDGYQGEVTVREAALRNIEARNKAGWLTDRSAEIAEIVAQRDDTGARYVAAAGSAEYASAFAKLVRDNERGHMLWTPQEQRAFQQVDSVRAAMGIASDGIGKVMVPLHLDPAIILTNSGTLSPLRAISRVVQVTGSKWNGVASAGASAEWVGEGVEVADGAPTLAQPSIPVHKWDCFVPYSVEIEGDAQNFLPELQRAILDAIVGLHDTAYTLGTGNGQPTGIVTALAASSPSVVVAGGGSEALAAGDPYLLQNALGARYQANASFMAALPVINALKQFETAAGSLKFSELSGNPARLLNRPMHENSLMDSSVNAAATEANYLALYGDFSNFVIVDRVGTTVELVPHLFGANRRPTLQRGIILWGRTGSDSVNDNAFRMLSVATTA